MKRILAPIILALTFSVMFSSTSFADWTKVSENVDGTTLYVDFERIRKHGGYVYWWELSDLLKPDKDGDWSYKSYNQGDCKLFRSKLLSISLHKVAMGRGTTGVTHNYNNDDWIYPPPNSSSETIQKSVCSR